MGETHAKMPDWERLKKKKKNQAIVADEIHPTCPMMAKRRIVYSRASFVVIQNPRVRWVNQS